MPKALALPNWSALRLMMSKMVLTSSEGVVTNLSFAIGCLRGMVSPLTGSYPEASTVNGGLLTVRGWSCCVVFVIFEEESEW